MTNEFSSVRWTYCFLEFATPPSLSTDIKEREQEQQQIKNKQHTVRCQYKNQSNDVTLLSLQMFV